MASVLSSDQEEHPDTYAILGASFALSLSPAPFEGPIGAVRIGRIDGQMIINPTYAQSEKGDMNIVVAGSKESVIMVEAGLNFVTEEFLVNFHFFEIFDYIYLLLVSYLIDLDYYTQV